MQNDDWTFCCMHANTTGSVLSNGNCWLNKKMLIISEFEPCKCKLHFDLFLSFLEVLLWKYWTVSRGDWTLDLHCFNSWWSSIYAFLYLRTLTFSSSIVFVLSSVSFFSDSSYSSMTFVLTAAMISSITPRRYSICLKWTIFPFFQHYLLLSQSSL